MGGFRRQLLPSLGFAGAALISLAGTIMIVVGATWVRQFDDGYIFRVIVTVGSFLVLSSVVVPLLANRTPMLSPRAFLGYGISPVAVAGTFLAFLLIGPGILLVPVAVAPVLAWPDPASTPVAWLAFPLLFMQGVLTISLMSQAGVALRRRPRLAAVVDFFGVLFLVLGLLVVLVVMSSRVPELRMLHMLARPFSDFFAAIPSWLALTPLGMMWAAPGLVGGHAQAPSTGWGSLGVGALLVVVLLIVWLAFVGRELSPTRRLATPRRIAVPGWFARFPTSVAGAIAARSLTYWIRDPRYLAVFAILPFIPALIVLVLWVGGVPVEISALIPLPIMILLLAWSTLHNDVAYDNTAVWQHVAAHTRGWADRRGRATPVLMWGVVLLAVGIPLAVWAHGDSSIAVPYTGVCVALLLACVGMSGLYSARFPYAAPRPGDPAWQSPQVQGSQGGVAQGLSLLLVLLVAAPAGACFVVWLTLGGAWGWTTLAVGVASGLIALLIGEQAGGRTFERRGPELIAFTARN